MRIYTPIFLFLLSFNSIAQEQTGLRLDRYSGVNGLMINPANHLSSPLRWDVNLVAGGFFTATNYGYFQNTRLPDLIRNTDQVYLATDFEDPSEIDQEMIIFDFYDDNRRKHGLAYGLLSGPGFMVNLDGQHAFGLFTNIRTMASAQNISPELGYYRFDRTPYGEEITIPSFDFAALSWMEIGLNYAFATEIDAGKLGIGISLKQLNGYEAFYFRNIQNSTITQTNEDSVSLNQASFEFGFTSTHADGQYNGLERNGGGWALDLGVSLLIDESEEGYRWKLGASLLDIGRIRMSGQAERHRFDLSQTVTLDLRDYEQLDNLDNYVQLLSDQLLGTSDASLQENEFSVWLPAALSLQADYSFTPNWYVGGLLMQRLPLSSRGNQVKRANLLAIHPRFDSRWLGISFPFLLYNWQDFRVGTSVRLGFLTIGSDNLGSILQKSDFTGTDFYIALKINPFSLGGGRSSDGRKKSRGKNVRCYEF